MSRKLKKRHILDVRSSAFRAGRKTQRAGFLGPALSWFTQNSLELKWVMDASRMTGIL